MRHRGLILMGLLLGALLLSAGAAQAQDDAAPAVDAAAQTEAAPASAVDWNEGVFVLLVIALVMGGLIGFEYVHRRKQSV